MLLLGALAVFGYLILRDEQPPETDDVIAAQTEVAQRRATLAAEETIVAQAASEQTVVAQGGSSATPPPAAAPTTASDTDGATDAAPTDPAGDQAEPTPAPGEAATEPAAAGATDTSGALTPEQLTAFLPDAAAAPAGLDDVSDDARDLATVVEALGGTRAAETSLTTWGWTGNVERKFNASDPAVIEEGATSFLVVSVHGFATPDAASEALPFFSDILVNGGGYQELDAPQLGDNARLLQKDEDGTTNVALYVQDGTVLFRIGASSTGGDPTTDAEDIMTTILENDPAP